jgi:hypothetical protein
VKTECWLLWMGTISRPTVGPTWLSVKQSQHKKPHPPPPPG